MNRRIRFTNQLPGFTHTKPAITDKSPEINPISNHHMDLTENSLCIMTQKSIPYFLINHLKMSLLVEWPLPSPVLSKPNEHTFQRYQAKTLWNRITIQSATHALPYNYKPKPKYESRLYQCVYFICQFFL